LLGSSLSLAPSGSSALRKFKNIPYAFLLSRPAVDEPPRPGIAKGVPRAKAPRRQGKSKDCLALRAQSTRRNSKDSLPQRHRGAEEKLNQYCFVGETFLSRFKAWCRHPSPIETRMSLLQPIDPPLGETLLGSSLSLAPSGPSALRKFKNVPYAFLQSQSAVDEPPRPGIAKGVPRAKAPRRQGKSKDCLALRAQSTRRNSKDSLPQRHRGAEEKLNQCCFVGETFLSRFKAWCRHPSPIETRMSLLQPIDPPLGETLLGSSLSLAPSGSSALRKFKNIPYAFLLSRPAVDEPPRPGIAKGVPRAKAPRRQGKSKDCLALRAQSTRRNSKDSLPQRH
jgi:hypothetical protein